MLTSTSRNFRKTDTAISSCPRSMRLLWESGKNIQPSSKTIAGIPVKVITKTYWSYTLTIQLVNMVRPVDISAHRLARRICAIRSEARVASSSWQIEQLVCPKWWRAAQPKTTKDTTFRELQVSRLRSETNHPYENPSLNHSKKI